MLLLADAGYAGYGNIVTTSTKLVTEKPDLVQRFIDASIEGWYSYLYGDPTPANTLIKQDNPEMPDALLSYGRDVMKAHGIVDSGDALKLGIGAMTDARWAEFYRSMADVGVYPKGLDVTKAYTLRFVDQRVGMDLRALTCCASAAGRSALRSGRGAARRFAGDCRRRLRRPARAIGLRQVDAAAIDRRTGPAGRRAA